MSGPTVGLDLRDAPQQLRDRFWSKVLVGEPDECWEWTAYRKPSGYGSFKLGRGTYATASRVALALTIGVVPADQWACHHCDNPPCCNPAHLFAGTSSENALDSVAKGRARRARGEACPSSRLTEADVRVIRDTPRTWAFRKRLALEYGVSSSTIYAIRTGAKWRHVA